MLLLGVVQAQAAGDVSFGSYDLLQTEILTGTQASVTFSSLGDYATDYQHLQIRWVARDTAAFAQREVDIRINADSTTSYSSHRLAVIPGAGLISEAFASKTLLDNLVRIPANTETADIYGAGVIDILDPYETTKNTTFRLLGGFAGVSENTIALSSSAFLKTDAVSSVQFIAASGYAIGSRFSLYGLKASV